MRFGKHKGKLIEDVPPDYIVWLLDNVDDLSIYMRQAIEDRLEALGWRRAEPPSLDPRRTTAVVLAVVKEVRRELAGRYHPDRHGGSTEAMAALNSMVDELNERIPERLHELART